MDSAPQSPATEQSEISPSRRTGHKVLEDNDQIDITTTSSHSGHTETANIPENDSTSFTDAISQYRLQLEQEFNDFAKSVRSKETELEPLAWSDLEQRYRDEMQVQLDEERKIMSDFDTNFKQFMLWMQISNEREAERALKRLRTRIAFVQNSESQLSEKQDHYAKVLQAFQSAMALLGNL